MKGGNRKEELRARDREEGEQRKEEERKGQKRDE